MGLVCVAAGKGTYLDLSRLSPPNQSGIVRIQLATRRLIGDLVLTWGPNPTLFSTIKAEVSQIGAFMERGQS